VVVMRWEVFSASPVPPFGVVSKSVLLRRPPSNHLVLPSFAAVRFCARRPFVWVELICGGPDLFWWVAVFSVFSSHLPPRVGKFGGPKGRWWRCHTPLLCVSKPVRVGSVLLPVVVGSFSTSAVV
jgi:hypothetical protein